MKIVFHLRLPARAGNLRRIEMSKSKIVARCIEPGCKCLDVAGVIYSSLSEVPVGYEVLPTGGCESALLGSEGCSFEGPGGALTMVEYMPEDLRASHAAAGNRGVYPYNGAIRARVCPDCLRYLFLYDGGWVKEVR
jgi:hypothetical protein